ncbi:NAD-dependent epimerase/dehydratase family protein [Arthrobacter sp. MDB2-24]
MISSAGEHRVRGRTPVSKKVFLTGATGNWGKVILREFRERSDRFDIVALVLPTPKDIEAIREFEDMDNLTVVFGDLTDYSTVAQCVEGADYILHTGAVVSPLADDNPELTHRVNVGGTRNIIQAVKAQPQPDTVSIVMIGSIAETGDRNPPHHWGRIGDPIRVAQYDEYGQSKIIAERELVDSGLPRWAWLRQTGIFHGGLLSIRDAIMTHTPLDGVMEWVSVDDAARLLANICEDDVPEEFWNRIYNIGGGEDWRLTNWELQIALMGELGVGDPRKWFERNWFATKNFHGQWYTDSDILEKLVPFRKDSFATALQREIRTASITTRLAGRVPAWLVKNHIMKPITLHPRGTMAWIKGNDEDRINAYFGSRADWEAIGGWDTFWPPHPDRTPTYLDHGYDETKPPATWSVEDLRGAANFRGGTLVAQTLITGDTSTPLQWACHEGHTFQGSPRLILTGGHWCPECVKIPADYPRQAESNAFLRQLDGPRRRNGTVPITAPATAAARPTPTESSVGAVGVSVPAAIT